jgi:arylsulfatase
MFYVKGGKLTYIYNFLGLQKFIVASTQVLSPGKHQIRMEFTYDGGGLAKGGNVTLFIDGKAVGQGRVERTVPAVFSADETSDVGIKRGSPITPDMPAGKSAFNGTVDAVVIETSGESTDHLLDREQVMNMIMARQ